MNNMNKFPHIKCGNQKLNGDKRLQSEVALKDFGRENLQFRRFGAKIIVKLAVADIFGAEIGVIFFDN